MIRVLSLRTLGLLWLGLLTLVAVVEPTRLMKLNLLSVVIAFGVAALLFPGLTLALGVASLLVSPEYYLVVDRYVQAHFSFMGVHTMQKALVLASLGPVIARYGPRLNFNPAIAAVLAMYLISVAFSSRYPGLSQAQMLKTLVALLMPFLFFQIKIQRRWIDPTLFMIASLPIIAVLLGLMLQVAGIQDTLRRPWEIMQRDYAGAFRLGGATIPAFLALHAYVAFFVALYQAIIYKKRIYYLLGAVAFVVMVLSGTRTPTVCTILFAGFAFLFASPRDLRGSSKFVLSILGATLLAVMLAIYWDNLLARFFNAYGEGALNTSGRQAVWDFLMGHFRADPLFGRGIGTSAFIFIDSERFTAIQAPHNEYLKLLVDGGIVGLSLYLIGFVAFLVREARVLDRGQGILLFGFMLSFAAYSFTDNTISAPPSLVMFFALALIFAKARLERAGLTVG